MRLDLRRPLSMALVALAWASAESRAGYSQTNLVSDGFVAARTIDPNLKNPWGISNAPGGPFWVSNAGSNTSTLYDGQGVKAALTVAVAGGPTGQVFNNTTGFNLPSPNGSPAVFIFDTLAGGVYAWNGKAGTTAVSVASNAAAAYTGLALAASSSGNVLYAADNTSTHIDVYDSSFHSLTGSGGAFNGLFADKNLPAGFQAFNVVNLNGILYVTYNSVNGGGVIDEFTYDGTLIKRLATDLSGNQLAGPWSIVLAPTSFGEFGGDLLVSNNDNGTIAAIDPNTGAFRGDVFGLDGNPLVNLGIWSLAFGGTARNSDPNTLYVFAGLLNEQHGLVAAITAVPEPGSAVLSTIGGVAAFAIARRRRASRRG